MRRLCQEAWAGGFPGSEVFVLPSPDKGFADQASLYLGENTLRMGRLLRKMAQKDRAFYQEKQAGMK